MGKRKIEIAKIEDKQTKYQTFTKRRQGLFKKAADLCRLCDAQIAIIVFSPAGKLYSFGHPSVDAVIHQFLTGTTTGEEKEEVTERSDDGGFWWDNINMEELDTIQKIQAVKHAMLGLQQNVRKRIDELTSSSATSPSYTAAAGTIFTISTAEDRSSFLREGDDFRWPSDDELVKLDELAKFHNDDELFLGLRLMN